VFLLYYYRYEKKYYENTDSQFIIIPKSYQWIEDKLLKTPLPDYRKKTIDFVLVPYFINIKRANKNQVFCLVKEYIMKCNEIQPLLLLIDYFQR